MKNFTTEELRTLVWMCQNQASQIYLRDLKNGKKPSEDKTYQKILAISKKAYSELIDRNNQENTEKPEPVEIELEDNIPGMVIEPLELPERETPEDWDVFGKDDE